MLAGIQKRLDRFPPAERAARERLLNALVDVVLEESLDDLARLEQGFNTLPPADPARADREWLLGARARNAARALEDRARLEQESLPAAEVMRGLGVSRQRLHRLRSAGRLVAIRSVGPHGSRYPAWQFASDGRVIDGLEEILSAANDAEMGTETLHFFMTEPSARLDNRAPTSQWCIVAEAAGSIRTKPIGT